MISLKEHFPFHCRLYPWMFTWAYGFSMTVTYPTFHAKWVQMIKQPSPDTSISHGGTIPWPPHSPHRNPLDFSLQECIRENVYATKVRGHNNLINCILTTVTDIRGKTWTTYFCYGFQCHWNICVELEEVSSSSSSEETCKTVTPHYTITYFCSTWCKIQLKIADNFEIFAFHSL
jgi:hypothetical protein